MWPPQIPKCPKPLADFLSALIKRHDEGWPIDGLGIKCADGANGRSINALSAGGSGTARGQLQIYKIDDTTIGISPGSLAELPVDAEQTLTVSGGTEGAPKKIYGKVSVSSADVPTDPEWYDNGTTDEALDEDYAYKLLGTYWTDDDGSLHVNPLVGGSQGLGVCRTYPDNFVSPHWSLS